MKPPERLLFASTNYGKFDEVRLVLAGYKVVVISPEQYRLELSRAKELPEYPSVDEDGTTYSENARKKADIYYTWSNMATLGDDSGLEVRALGGAPGLYSARYAGEGATSQKNREKLLWALRDVDDRAARICCALSLRLGPSKVIEVEASLSCNITREVRGSGGFGYDSLLEVEGTGKTLAEFKEEGIRVKTHRELALDKLMAAIAAN